MSRPVTAPTLITTLRCTSLDSDQTDWTLSPLTELPVEWSAIGTAPVPATVPGEVYGDLLAAGLIPDPFDGVNEHELHWIGRTDWRYRTSFAFEPSGEQRHDLVFAGLDTLATVLLNGVEIARTANMHRSYRFDVTDLIRTGGNELEVRLEGPVAGAERLSDALIPRPHTNVHPYNAVRKMAASYGWDWGPDLAGAGIWKSVAIESWSDVRLGTVRPLALLDGSDGLLQAHVELEWAEPFDKLRERPTNTKPFDKLRERPTSTEVRLTIGDQTVAAVAQPGQTEIVVETVVPDVERWWPTGYGPQTRYDVTVEVAEQTYTAAVGFRTAALSTTPDQHGTGFAIVVNDTPIYVKGFNWIPDDALLTRLSSQTYRTAITDAVEAGANLLRVWGGGIYESAEFYDVCDELGVLVWQDFLFACAAYAEEEPLRGEIVAEAREAVARLSSRPSLVVWNGNNENIWGYVEWGWRARLGELTWGDGYYTEILPAVVAELDPRTPYSPGSPYSYAKYHHPNDFRSGTMHIWDVWNQIDYSHYRDYPARFVSEFGFQGPPAWSTLTSVVHDEPLDPYGPQMLVHQKAHEGNIKLARGLGEHLPPWRDDPEHQMDEWHWLTSLNQARAVAYGIEHLRSHYPRNRGSIVWQLNDNWPVVSWAAVDGAGIRKPLWHALRRVYGDRLVTFQPREAGLVLAAHNDTGADWSGELVITRRDTGSGTPVLAEQRLPFHVAARSALTIPLDDDVASPSRREREFLVAVTDGADTAFSYFVEDPVLSLAPVDDALTVAVAPAEGGYAVTVEATALVKDLTLFPDRLDPAARVDTALITLAAGERHTFVITSDVDLDEGALTTRPILRSVNDLRR